MPSGRPSEFSQERADTICLRLAEGESLRAICRDDDMPSQTTVFRWLAAKPTFCEQYTRARALQAERWSEEIIEISDDATRDTVQTEAGERADHEWISRSRLRVDTRKWLMSKLAPKKYGDKLLHAGPDGTGPVTVSFQTVYEQSK